MRLFTQSGYDWTGRYPWIAESARRNRTQHFVLDGEAVVLRIDGVADFDALHSGRYALLRLDVLIADGEDLRKLSLHRIKVKNPTSPAMSQAFSPRPA